MSLMLLRSVGCIVCLATPHILLPLITPLYIQNMEKTNTPTDPAVPPSYSLIPSDSKSQEIMLEEESKPNSVEILVEQIGPSASMSGQAPQSSLQDTPSGT
jgi:hypothetical protein